MKLPDAKAPITTFVNAKGSDVPEEFSMIARNNPSKIGEMAETPSELKDLKKESLARQYVLIIDRSGSMQTPDGFRGTRWTSAKKAVSQIIEKVFDYDIDHSIPLYLFDDQIVFVGECTDVKQVTQVFSEFQPRGTTGLGQALETALEAYAGTKRVNFETVPGTTVIVVLDGGADNPSRVKSVLQKYADPANGYVTNHEQLAVSFLQIGDDNGATEFLKDLDDNLKPLDIVDTMKDDEVFKSGGVEKLLMNAIFD